ncbi:MAG: hypothetical protein QM758_06345 [Armatimonas sp.]
MTQGAEPITFTLTNADLADPKDPEDPNSPLPLKAWEDRLKKTDRDKLIEALGVESIASLRGKPGPGSNTYLPKLTQAEKALKLVANQRMTAEIDHLALRFLFGIKGVVFSREVTDTPVQGPASVEFDNQDVVWTIKLYPVEIPGYKDLPQFYRASIVAECQATTHHNIPWNHSSQGHFACLYPS